MSRRFGQRGRLALAGSLTAAFSVAAPSALASAAPTSSTSGRAVVGALSTSTYGDVLTVGGSGPFAGAPLYEISSDDKGKIGCTTALQDTFQGPITCTGPESDIANNVFSDEWPAFTTIGRPMAGPGVDQSLLGAIDRGPAIGWQVTYAGHPLYLFDPPSSPFIPAGENFLETTLPLPPWFGIWDLVSSRTGARVTGPATLETETLPSGASALAGEMYQNVVPGGVAATVYAFDGREGQTVCHGCDPTWIPLLTTGAPIDASGLPGRVGTIAIGAGQHQVTFEGHALYLYSGEEAVLGNNGPSTAGTMGNGNGLAGPHGGKFTVVTP